MRQPSLPPTPPHTTFAGQTVLITGGNTGLGLETARQCLALHAKRVIITARSEAKANDALAALRGDAAVQMVNPDATIEAFLLDLDDYQSAIEFVGRVKQEIEELDVLVCNAGMTVPVYQMSRSGHERIMQVNCYSHFLITLELLPLLRKTAAAHKNSSRLTIVGSYSHENNTLVDSPVPADVSIVDHLDDPAKYVPLKQYMNSKLFVLAFIQHLATIVPASEVIVNVPCPGVVATAIMRDCPLWLRAFMFVWYRTLGRSVEEGARALVYAVGVAGEESHGRFLSDNRVASGSSLLQGKEGEELARRVWQDSCSDILKVKPDVPIPTA